MTARDVKLILASGSPQRKQLLLDAGYTFEAVSPRDSAECGVCSRESPGEMVARLALQKAQDVCDQIRAGGASVPSLNGQVLVACDTVAECLGQILGKPHNREHARQMLELLSGREHRVYSGLCVLPLATAEPHIRVARTTLRMDSLAADAIEEYLDSELWQGKAGSFGYQDRAGWLHIVAGSESNVIGLPMELLAEMLAGAA